MNQDTLVVSEVTKAYGGILALDRLSLKLPAGVAYGLLGLNGCGKTTFLRLLATLERPDSGRIAVLGHDLSSATRLVRRSIGFVRDDYRIYRGLNVMEHLDFFARCYGLRRRERLAAVDTMLQLVDLDDARKRPVEKLSRGQRQRLALASAMIHDPEVLLLDEPLAGLDPTGRDEMLEVIKELRSMGKTIVLASHTCDDVSRVCDAVGILSRGRLVASGAPQEVLSNNESLSKTVRLRVVSGLEIARTILLQMPQAGELTIENDRVTFAFGGDAQALPDVLSRLIKAGVLVSEFSATRPGTSETIMHALQELAA